MIHFRTTKQYHHNLADSKSSRMLFGVCAVIKLSSCCTSNLIRWRIEEKCTNFCNCILSVSSLKGDKVEGCLEESQCNGNGRQGDGGVGINLLEMNCQYLMW